jgi:hypothetical protein
VCSSDLLLWLPSSWIAEGLPFWAITITLGFALAELRLKGAATMLDLPGYVMDGVRPLIIVVPLHLAVLALVWCAGSLRLRPGKSDAGVSAYEPLLAFIAVLIGGLVIWQGSALPWAVVLANILSAPLRLPIQAGFGLLAWLPGSSLACAEALLCLSALGIVAREISISWAAHESIPGLALTLTDPDAARLHKTRERLGAGRKSTRLPSMPGLGALFWKQVLQTQRTWRIQDALTWLGVFSMGLVVGLVSGLGPLAWVIVVWVIMCGKLTTNPLRDDLKNWHTLRQMPFSTLRLIWVEVALPMAGVVLATWAGLALAVNAPGGLRLGLAILTPAAAAMAAASAVYDIARQARAALLLNGVCPDLSALGALLGLLGPAVCAGGVYWATKSGVPMLVGGLGGMLLCAYMAYLIGSAAAGKIQKME